MPVYNSRGMLEESIIRGSLVPANTSGSFCDLFIGSHPTVGKVALKRLRSNFYDYNTSDIQASNIGWALGGEANTWIALSHPHVLQFLGIHRIDNFVYLTSPFAENGSLPEFIKRRPEVNRRRLVLEIAEGLTYLHQSGIIHGDLKGNNVLVSTDEHILISDFGLAKHLVLGTAMPLKITSSIPWQSPEVLMDSAKLTFQSDVYAFGITIFEVNGLRAGYSANPLISISSGVEWETTLFSYTGLVSVAIAVLLSKERPPREPPTSPEGTSYLPFWNEASKCWEEDPSIRPTIFDVLLRLDRLRTRSLEIFRSGNADPPLGFGLETKQKLHRNTEDDSRLSLTDRALQIRVRTNELHNSLQPVEKLTLPLLGKILAADQENLLNYGTFLDTLATGFRPGLAGGRIHATARRVAILRRVSKTWCCAIESNRELWRYVAVVGKKSNVSNVLQNYPEGPIECTITNTKLTDIPTLDTVSVLRPLSHRIRTLIVGCESFAQVATDMLEQLDFSSLSAIYHHPYSWEKGAEIKLEVIPKQAVTFFSYNVPCTIHSTALPKLRTLIICNAHVPRTFGTDLLMAICSSPDLRDLVLQCITADRWIYLNVETQPVHRCLERVRLYKVPYVFKRTILCNLRIENCKIINAADIEPALLAEESAFIHTMRAVYQSSDLGPADNCIIVYLSRRNSTYKVTFNWRVKAPDAFRSPSPPMLWSDSFVQTVEVTSDGAARAAAVFSNLATVSTVKIVELNAPKFPKQALAEILSNLPHTETLLLDCSDFSRFLEPLARPVKSQQGSKLLLCPRLTRLGVIREWSWKDAKSFFKRVAQRRDAELSKNGQVVLCSLGVPEAWRERVKLKAKGIEVSASWTRLYF